MNSTRKTVLYIVGLVLSLSCLALTASQSGATGLTVVVLGSSTAWGANATPMSQSWVNRYTAYLQSVDPANRVVNLAVIGTTTYHILPNGTPPVAGRPGIYPGHNITAALALHPDAVIVNMPSNDTANGFTASEQQANYQAIASAANNAGVPLWVATTQPRNMALPLRQIQMTMRDWIKSTFGTKAIDFWTTLADSDALMVQKYNSGDGLHFNNAGHAILFERVVQAGIPQALNHPVLCPTLNPSDLSPAVIAQPYSNQITVTGGTGDYSFVGTGLPSWLALSTTGILSGTPPDTNDASFLVTVTDLATLCSSTRNYTLLVTCPPFALPPPQLPNATVGSPYNVSLGPPPPDPNTVPAGGARYTYSGTLPDGFVLNPNGSVTGTPIASGPQNFTVTITDTVTGCQEQSAESIQVLCPTIALTPSQGAPTSLPAATAGQAYSQTVGVPSATGGYTFTVSSGTLPSGLDMSATGALATISGIPSVAGSYDFEITATDTGSGCSGTQSYRIVVTCPTLAFTPNTGATTALLDAGIAQAYSQTITVAGGSGSYSFGSADIPAWLTMAASTTEPATAVLSGTPTEAGDFSFTVTATESKAGGCAASQTYSVHVAGPLPLIFCPGGIAVTAAPGSCSAPVAFAVRASGTPPPTVVTRLHSTGEIVASGAIFPIGTSTVDCSASNGLMPDATCSFDVIVSAAPLPTPPAEGFYQGFEVDSEGWHSAGTTTAVLRVPSGTHGIASRTGEFHAEASGPFDALHTDGGALTDWGGARTIFYKGGYTTSIAVYLDVAGIPANDTRFAWDSAVNDSSGALRRDFVFNVGGYTDGAQPSYAISAGMSTERSTALLTDPAGDPLIVTTSGWYTLQHRFTDHGGVLQAELTVIDSTGAVLHSWTLSDPRDAMCGIGGDRTGAFTLQEYPYVAFDDSSLLFNDATTRTYFRDADGDGFGDGTKPIQMTAAVPPTGYVSDGTDCNDVDATVHAPQAYYRDADGDGYGDPSNSIVYCSAAAAITVGGVAYVSNHDDCNDNDPALAYPVIYYRDQDGDGFGDPASPLGLCSTQPPTGYVRGNTDCNDLSALIHPGVHDVTDGLDNNCNGFVDEGVMVSLDFESLSGGQAVAEAYAAQSVHFRNALAVQDSHPFQNYFPPASGIVNVTNDLSDIAPHTDIEITFDAPEQVVSVFVTARRTATMTAYDLSGNVVGSQTVTGNYQSLPGGTNHPNALLKISTPTPTISRVVFSDSGNEPSSITIDDLSFAPTGYPCNFIGVTRALRLAAGLDVSDAADARLTSGANPTIIELSDAVRLVRCATGLCSTP